MKRFAERLLWKLGYTLARHGDGPAHWLALNRRQASRAYEKIKASSMLSQRRLYVLFALVDLMNHQAVEGALVECGVWRGGAVGMMACATRLRGSMRDLHLFDAFADVCEPDLAVDGERAIREVGGVDHAQGRLRSVTGFYDRRGGHGTIEACRRLLEDALGYPPARIHFHPGWFQDTLTGELPGLERIALLRLDADWYASTKVCLDRLYDRVAEGGVVMADDYGAYDGCRKAVDEFIAGRSLRVFRNFVDTECMYWFKGRPWG